MVDRGHNTVLWVYFIYNIRFHDPYGYFYSRLIYNFKPILEFSTDALESLYAIVNDNLLINKM